MSSVLYESVTNSILEALRRGVVPWRKPWSAGVSVPMNAVTSKPYRGVNVLLLGISEYADHRWLTFNQVQERHGKVKAGEKATMVVFWKRWEPPREDDSNSKVSIPILRYYNVFNVEQCDDLGLAEIYRPEPLKDHERIERADLFVRSMPDPPVIRERGSSAWYRPVDDLVQIPPLAKFDSPDAYYATLFHELGHATGHAKRLNRFGINCDIQFGSGTYSKEELVAELTSAFSCGLLGLDNSLIGNSASYINGWLSVLKGDPKAVVIAAAQAQRAADHIRGVQYTA